MNSAIINVRTDEETKKQSEQLFKDLGLTMTTAVNMFLRQSLMTQGIPFQVVKKIPNQETLDAMKEVEEMTKHPEKYKSYSDVDEMFEDRQYKEKR